MNLKFFNIIFFLLMYSHAIFAIEPVYEGEDGIRAGVFATNCLFCHSSELTGSQRNGAPSNVNWDTFSTAKERGDRAIVRAVDQMTMPPSFSGLPTLNQEQKDAMLAWQQAGFPRFPTNATYDFDTQILTLPVVNVGESVFRVTLRLVEIPGSSLGFGFILETAELSEDSSTTAASFISETGEVDIPEVDLLNIDASSNKVNLQIILMPETTPLTFAATSVAFIN